MRFFFDRDAARRQNKISVLFATRSRVFDGVPGDLQVVELNGGAVPVLGDPYGTYENRLNARMSVGLGTPSR